MRFILILLASMLWIGPAFATATVGINAFLNFSLEGYIDEEGNVSSVLPDGVTVDCGSCSWNAGLYGSNSTSQLKTYNANISDIISITNVTDHDIGGFFRFFAIYSAFTYDSFGIGIDDPLLEYASYESEIEFDGQIVDFHSCDTHGGGNDTYRTPTHCGVTSPDDSTVEFYFDDLGAGETVQADMSITMTSQLLGAPEPASIVLLLPGTVMILRRKKSRLPIHR